MLFLMNNQQTMIYLEVFNKLNNNEIDTNEANNEVIKLTGSDDTMFFDIRTIYKVKNNEKKN